MGKLFYFPYIIIVQQEISFIPVPHVILPFPRPGPQNETKGLGMRPKGLRMRLPCQQCCNMRQVDVQEVVLSHDGREVGALHPFHHHQVDKAGQTKGRE